MSWYKPIEKRPVEGESVLVFKDRSIKTACYCDGGFYSLEYDPWTGVLRKIFVDKVDYWTELVIPDLGGV